MNRLFTRHHQSHRDRGLPRRLPQVSHYQLPCLQPLRPHYSLCPATRHWVHHLSPIRPEVRVKNNSFHGWKKRRLLANSSLIQVRNVSRSSFIHFLFISTKLLLTLAMNVHASAFVWYATVLLIHVRSSFIQFLILRLIQYYCLQTDKSFVGLLVCILTHTRYLTKE